MTQRRMPNITSPTRRRRQLQEYQGAMLTEAAVPTKVLQAESVIDSMLLPHSTGLILAGSTGIGKTTFIKQLAKLFGMNVIIVEAPHVSEEHLINIPFTVTVPNGNKKSGVDQRDPDTYDIVLGKSFLASELEKSKPISEAELLKFINGADDNIKEMWKHFGGTSTTIPAEFKKIRSKYHVMLFLDEYFRQTSKNVRNMLRNILNGRIGNDPIPLGTYVIYASNLNDVSGAVEDIPLNADFQKMQFHAPTKEEWFTYLVNRYKNSSVVKLKPEVVSAFRNALTDADISYDDKNTELRTSPRRWEQLILYVNAALPCKDLKDARALLASVKANFQYGDAISDMYRKVEPIVKQLITATNPAITNPSPADTSDWRNVLLHQLQVKMQLGNIRSYVPIVQGEPGIGKTHFAAMVADQLNMSLIPIDCSTLTADDLVGIPIPKIDQGKTAGEGMQVGFAEPVLYKRIIQDMALADKEFNANPKISAEKKAKYNNATYKYLLFFDELTRVNSPTVYNALRRVILEKEFNDDYRIPESCIIVGAMNPYDVGVQEITGHLKDSIDIIDATPAWSSWESHVKNSVFKRIPDISQAKKQAAWDLLNAFADTFTTKQLGNKINSNNRKFYIQYGPNPVTDLYYASPREYDVLFQTLAATINRATSPQDLAERLVRTFRMTVEWIHIKHKLEIPAFEAKLDSWVRQYAASMSRLITEKQRDTADLAPMLDRVLEDPDEHLYNNISFLNLLKNFSANNFSDQLRAYLYDLAEKELDDPDTGRLASVFISSRKKQKVLDNKGNVQVTNNFISEAEYIINEIKIATDKAGFGSDCIDETRKTLHDFLIRDLKQLCDKHNQPLSKAEFAAITEKLTKKIY
jgi:DNA polymerase III delta prime subunit